MREEAKVALIQRLSQCIHPLVHRSRRGNHPGARGAGARTKGLGKEAWSHHHCGGRIHLPLILSAGSFLHPHLGTTSHPRDKLCMQVRFG